MADNKTVIAFDAYGTLLSTESIAKKLAEHFGEEKAPTLAATWRKYQLEYTWRLNSMNVYVDFEAVTKGALQQALAEGNVSLNEEEITGMMKAYDTLSIFPDVAKALESLKSRKDMYPVVFSNGTQRMVSASVKHSPDLKDHKDVLQDIVVVEEPRRYKPAPETYHHLATQVGKDVKKQMSEMWLVSGNPFDIVGARKAGMNALWIDRAGSGWQDHILSGPEGQPTKIIKSLEEVITVIDSHSK